MRGSILIFLSGVLVSFGFSCTLLTPKPDLTVTERKEQIEVAIQESIYSNRPDTLSVRPQKMSIVPSPRKGSLHNDGVMR